MRRKYLYMLLIKGLSAFLMFASQVLPARCLDLDEFGSYSYLNSILVVLMFIVGWGTDRYCLKEVSLARKPADDSDSKSTLESEAVGGKLFGTSAIILINTLLVTAGLAVYLSYRLPDEYSIGLIAVCLLVLFGRSAALVISSVVKGIGRVLESEIVFSVLRPLAFAIVMGGIYLASLDVTVNNVLALFGLSFLLVFIIMLVIVVRDPLFSFVPQWGQVPVLYQVSLFFLLVGVGLPLMANINTIQLGNMRSKEEVALYSAAAKLVSLVLLALVSANLLIAPRLSPLFYENRVADMRKLIRGNNFFVAALTVVPVIVVLFFAEQILELFGNEYVAAAPLLRMLVIGQAFSVACGPVVLTATLCGLQKVTAAVVLICCLVNWLLCVALIPSLGSMGAVYASVVGNVLINGTLAIVLYQRIGLNVTMLNMIRST